MRLLLVLLALLSWCPSDIVAQAGTAKAYETVLVPSGTLTLKGLLWKPVGRGPFPAVLFNHGAGRNDIERAEVIGPIFARQGYVFLYLFRRGYGPSADQGEYMRDILDREAQARGEDARKRLYLKLLTTDHLDDVMAGLTFLKRIRGVDPRRVALAGHSFGGSLTLLAAERDKRVRAIVSFAAAAQNWDGSPEYRNRLLAAIRNDGTPLFLTHAANDFSIAPGQILAAESARLKRPHELKIYPPVGATPAAGHAALYTDVAAWESDVFRFLDQHVKRLSSGQKGVDRIRLVKAGAATIYVRARGRGTPIVLIPSRGRGSEDFGDLSTKLVRAGYQVVLPQPRGIGGSTGPLEDITYHDLAADIAATIRELGVSPAAVVGHAFGSRLARTLAADHPALVRCLILIAVPGPVQRSRKVAEATDRVFDTTVKAENRLKAIQETFFAKGNDARVWRHGWHYNVARAQRAADARMQLAEWWAGGSAPMLLLQGADDVITVPENAKRLAAEFPDRVILVEIPKAGHAMLPEQPERIASAILSYLAR